MPAKISYTYTDEAPMLATYAFYPIIKAFTNTADVDIELKDISVASRVLANLGDNLKDTQRVSDTLMELGELAKTPEAIIVKLPNVSASLPQLKECIRELQVRGYAVPDYPEIPKNEAEHEIKARYGKVMGSAVNPVLREGNSDRRAAVPVKEYARKNPHVMGRWGAESKTHVAHMSCGDFYENEQSVVVDESCSVKIEHLADDGTTTVLKEKTTLSRGEIFDTSFMSCLELRTFFENQIQDAKANGVLFSLHLKATMMKISDPIMFGHCVSIFYKDVFEKHAGTFAKIGVNANNGLGDVYKKIASLPEQDRTAIEADIQAVYATRPKIAMVDSEKGITNLHVPSDIIIDNSMPNAIRGMAAEGGQMWTPENTMADIKAVIPDRCYAGVFKECIEFCKKNGAFDPCTMGSCPNVGLMAQKAQEYGSHDKTFEIKSAGVVRVVRAGSGDVLMQSRVEQGDIWRACQVKDVPIKDWVKLAVTRGRATPGCKVIFWLDEKRAHDRNLIQKVRNYLPAFNPAGLDIEIMDPVTATRATCQRAKAGLDTISATGNVLRDYLTDLFPILELGSSSKMLSIVPLLAGGGMYETGAGGSAPKHVEQFVKEGHLRWDSLGEYLALQVALEDYAVKSGNRKAGVLAAAMNQANTRWLDENKAPGRNVKQLDNRGSHLYLCLYWAEALAAQSDDAELKAIFAGFAKELRSNEGRIMQELTDCQGSSMDIGGHYLVDPSKADRCMRPSSTFNAAVAKLASSSAKSSPASKL